MKVFWKKKCKPKLNKTTWTSNLQDFVLKSLLLAIQTQSIIYKFSCTIQSTELEAKTREVNPGSDKM